eukprot:RCo044432
MCWHCVQAFPICLHTASLPCVCPSPFLALLFPYFSPSRKKPQFGALPSERLLNPSSLAMVPSPSMSPALPVSCVSVHPLAPPPPPPLSGCFLGVLAPCLSPPPPPPP